MSDKQREETFWEELARIEFQDACETLMIWLKDNNLTNACVIIDSTRAQLVENTMVYKTSEKCEVNGCRNKAEYRHKKEEDGYMDDKICQKICNSCLKEPYTSAYEPINIPDLSLI